MFGTIRRHQSWLWAIIITITVICFVIFFSPNQKYGDGNRGKESFGTIAGKEISREEYRNAQAEVYLHYFLTRGQWPDEDSSAKQMGFDQQRETYFRIMLIREQENRNIRVSDKVTSQMAAEILRGGRGQSVSLEDFEKQVLVQRGLSLIDFENFIRHEIGNQQLISVIGISGKLITPQQAEALYRHENEEISSEGAFFSASNFLSSVTVNSNALAQFFQLHQAEYRIPPRMQVNYVKFEITNFVAAADDRLKGATNFVELAARLFPQNRNLAQSFATTKSIDEVVDLLYRMRGTNFYSDLGTNAAKAKIKDELRNDEARLLARKKANQFVDPLLSSDAPKPEMLSLVAKTNEMTVQVTKPFSINEPSPELKLLPPVAQKPFELTPETPFAEPLDGEDGIYVIGYNKALPSENPLFESIRERVTADFKFAEALDQARTAANSLSRNFTNTPAAGSFSNACVAAKGDFLKIPAFSLSTRSLPQVEDRLSLGQLQNVAFGTPDGKVSDVSPTQDGAFVLHVISRAPADAAKLSQELPKYLASLRQGRQNDAFNQWFRKRVSDEPLLRQITSEKQNR
jgi:hypothetical protein